MKLSEVATVKQTFNEKTGEVKTYNTPVTIQQMGMAIEDVGPKGPDNVLDYTPELLEETKRKKTKKYLLVVAAAVVIILILKRKK